MYSPSEACCDSCRTGKPCAGGACGTAKGAGAIMLTQTNERGGWPPDPLKTKYRTVTGEYPAYVPRASGDVDEDTALFLQQIRGLPDNERAAAIQNFMRARQASDDQTRAAIAAFAQGGLATLTAHLNANAAAERTRIEQAGQTERARIEQETRIELQRLQNEAAANGYVGNTGLSTVPQTPLAPPRHAPMSTGTKVAIGVGVGALVLLAGYAVYKSSQPEPYARGRG